MSQFPSCQSAKFLSSSKAYSAAQVECANSNYNTTAQEKSLAGEYKSISCLCWAAPRVLFTHDVLAPHETH
jgi:hypothetical protein